MPSFNHDHQAPQPTGLEGTIDDGSPAPAPPRADDLAGIIADEPAKPTRPKPISANVHAARMKVAAPYAEANPDGLE